MLGNPFPESCVGLFTTLCTGRILNKRTKQIVFAQHSSKLCFFIGENPYIGVRGSPERGYFVPACVGSGRWADFERCSRIHACGLRCLGGKTLKTLSKSILLARNPLITYSFLTKNTPMARN